MDKRILACDVYGTFLDTSAIEGAILKQLSLIESLMQSKATQIAASWRKYQLEYTWRLNSMGKYEDFDAVTRKSLRHAAADIGTKLSEEAVSAIMAAYYQLPSFPDAEPAWKELAASDAFDVVIFSNGTQEMVSAALRAAGLTPAPSPATFVLADDAQCFKPSARIYDTLLKKVGKETSPHEVWLVSSNPFDIIGAAASGLCTIWVDRAQTGWKDQLGNGLGPGGRELAPTKVVDGLGDIVSSLGGTLDHRG